MRITDRWRGRVAYVVMGVGFLGGIWRVETKAHAACEGQNEVRREVINSNGELLARAKRSFEATVISPTASALQKETARKNLQGIEEIEQAQRERLKPKNC